MKLWVLVTIALGSIVIMFQGLWRNLETSPWAHPDVIAHWRGIVEGRVPFDFTLWGECAEDAGAPSKGVSL